MTYAAEILADSVPPAGHRLTTFQITFQQWLLSCIGNANPQSDEEPEDWIVQCEQTGVKAVCPVVPVVFYDYKSVSCALVREPHIKAVCPEGAI